MSLSGTDLGFFIGFLALVVGVSLYASRKEESADDYFLAGRSLPWWLIGVSLIASNISSEHFVGMAGEGFQTGLAIACFEWVAAIALVFVALVLLPRFLRSGIYTLPEYLEYRYGPAARAIMAFYLMVVYVIVGMAGVLYSGSLALNVVFGTSLATGVWLIGLIAGGYTIYGGLKAVVWSDLIQGLALLGGGALLLVISLESAGGPGACLAAHADKLHLMLPADHPTLPWTIYLMGIWIPNIAYWGLNQFITQRALAAKNLKEGQKGVLFAALLKLTIPFFVVFPGIAAWQLYGDRIPVGDQAFPFLMTHLLPEGLRGVMFAALFGAVMSSLDSMLNSASTIFTIDLYSRHIVKRELEAKTAVRIGRVATAAFVLFACLLAPELAHLGGIYEYMQRVWNFIWPGILAVFLVGIVSPKAPPAAATAALILGPLAYGGFMIVQSVWLESRAYLNAAAVSFIACCALMLLITWRRPLAEPRLLPDTGKVETTAQPGAKLAGAGIVALTVLLYVIFW